MSKIYGDAARRAALATSTSVPNPLSAWTEATASLFPNKLASQRKSCPKNAFLGLCDEGLIEGIPRGSYSKSKLNKDYAIRAVAYLVGGHSAADPRSLWKTVMSGEKKTPNGQMDVVLALWNAGLIKS